MLLIRDFIAYRKASGRWNEASYESNLHVFDRFYIMNYPGSVHLTQKMTDRWCRQRDSETNNFCRSRIYVVYNFIKYLLEKGLSEVLLPRMPRKKRVTYILRTFSGDETRNFLKACDNLPGIPKIRNILIRRIMVPVFFRLPYGSNICTIEAKLLGCADVDVGNGVLDIRYSKGHDQYYIVLYDSMADLIRRYDSAIREWFLSRKYFFPAPGDTAHSHIWVEKNFRRIWAEAFNDRTATAYTLRHHYATANINRWIEGGFAFDDEFTCPSKSMGRMTLESTWYYYSVVPGLSDIVLEKTEGGFNESVPEVAN